MEKGTGKKNQPIYGTAALLSNIRKQGGWEKTKQQIIITAAMPPYVEPVSEAAPPAEKKRTKPAPGAIRKATDKGKTRPAAKD